MKTRKFKGHLISDRKPEVGDTMICVQRKNINYGLTTFLKYALMLDTVNWKVIVYPNECKQELVDAVIESLKKDFAVGDYTVLDELLKFIPDKNLVQSLPEEQFKNFPKIKLK